MLAREGGLWVRAASSSMAPLVREGDSFRLLPLDRARPRAGDLVAFEGDGALVVHRVLRRSPRGVVTKGDALPRADALVEWARVVARVAAIRTPAGRLLDLDLAPWRAVGPFLAALARPPASSRAAWIALRAPFHLLAPLGR